MKRTSLLSKADGGTLSKIIVNITLPSVVIVSLSKISVTSELFFLLAMGMALNAITVLVGSQMSKKRSPLERKYQMYSMSGYNIGNFGLPFVQGFFPVALPFLLMFDIGNSVMLTGGSTLLIDKLVGENKETSIKNIAFSLLKSTPFTVYMIMLILRMGDIGLPREALSVLQIIANANGFLSMFMIGLYFEMRLPRKALYLVGKILFSRYLIAVILALIFALILPLKPLLRISLVLICVTPMPTFSVINCVKAGMDEEIVGFTSSASILFSLLLMTIVMFLMA